VLGAIERVQEMRALDGSLTVPMTGTGAVRLVPSLGPAIDATGASVTDGSTTTKFALAVPTLPAASPAEAFNVSRPAVG